MDVDAMDELMYDTLIRYFKTLAHTGYKSYDVVFKMLVMDFIYEITHTELRYYITNKDIKLMQDLLYQLFGSTCEISFPTNNRPCCVCVCCNGEGTTPPPVVVPTTTTTSTKPPIEPTYLILSSTVANTAYVDYELVEMWTPIKVEVGSRVTIMAQSVSGYTFKGFYVAGSLISNSNTLQYTIPSTGTNTIELRYEEEEESTTTTTTTTSSTTTTTSSTPAPVLSYLLHLTSTTSCKVTGKFGGAIINESVTSGGRYYTVHSATPPAGTITSCVADNSDYKFTGVYDSDSGDLLSSNLPYSWKGNKNIELRFSYLPPDTSTTTTTTSTTTLPPTRYYMVSMVSDIPCNVTGKFGGDNISGEVTSNAKRCSIESGSVPRGTITTCSAKEVGYVLKGIYDADNGSLLASSLPFSWSGSKNLRFKFEQTITTTTSSTTSSTTTTSSTSTQPPAKTSTIVFEHDPKTAYTVTYNGSDKLIVSDLKDGKIELNFPAGINSLQFIINSIVCANSNYKCNEIRQDKLSHSLPYSISVAANQYITITPVIADSEPTTTTTSSTTTSTLPPAGSNNVYYGVVKDYMSPLDFVGTPIDTLMKREGTKSKAITGTKVNEFAIPQNGYYTYLIVPVDKVELQYAAFTSGGITTVCYDSTKENIPNDTNNGIFFSKYTRGGVNANQGGAYNGINYDVYFVYNNYGGAPELINVKAKNK